MTSEEFSKLPNIEIAGILNDGGKFVIYTYTISILVMTFRRGSKVFLLKKDDSAIKHGFPYLIITLFLGWWGIPFGPIYSIGSIITAFKGKDVTDVILNNLTQSNH